MAVLCSTSESRGTWERVLSPSHSSDAARSGSTLFFAAGSRTVPDSLRPPCINMYSANLLRPPQAVPLCHGPLYVPGAVLVKNARRGGGKSFRARPAGIC